MFENIQRFWLKITELDLRSLAFVRISAGLLVAWMQFGYILQADVFFSDRGVCTRSAVAVMRTANKVPSFHKLTGDPDVSRALLFAGMLVGLTLALGWKTRFMTCLAWLVSVSAQARCPYMLQGSDTELNLLLLFMIFLPWGRVWSLDARHQAPPQTYRYRSWANGGILVQILIIYFAAVILKLITDLDWIEGTAVFYALHSGSRAKFLADYLLEAPLWFLSLLTWGSLLFEFVGPFLLFCGARARLFAVLSFALMHWSFGLFLTLGSFAWISPTATAVAIPTAFWVWIEKKTRPASQSDFGRAHRKTLQSGRRHCPHGPCDFDLHEYFVHLAKLATCH